MKVPEIGCITEHPGFLQICLNEYVLRVAYYQYKQRYGHRNEQGKQVSDILKEKKEEI